MSLVAPISASAVLPAFLITMYAAPRSPEAPIAGVAMPEAGVAIPAAGVAIAGDERAHAPSIRIAASFIAVDTVGVDFAPVVVFGDVTVFEPVPSSPHAAPPNAAATPAHASTYEH
jgi:hypothetical protein